jgi:glycosyltransferase involved in cell wall biosynthesis
MYVAVLPCYNVANQVEAVIDGLTDVFGEYIVAVDDGSTDETHAILHKKNIVVINHEHNIGKGAAIRNGIQASITFEPEGVLLIDSDGQHNPKEAKNFIDKHRQTGADIIIGARDFDKMPWIRNVSNLSTRSILSRKTGQKHHDPLNGYRLLSRNFIETVPLRANRYEIDLEIILQASSYDMSIEWIPIETMYTKTNPVFNSLPLKDVISQITYMMRYRSF